MKYQIARLTGTLRDVLETLNKKCEVDKLRVHSFQVHEPVDKRSPTYTFLLEPLPMYHIELPTYPASPPEPLPEVKHRQIVDETWRYPGHCSDCWIGMDYVSWPIAESRNHQGFQTPPEGK